VAVRRLARLSAGLLLALFGLAAVPAAQVAPVSAASGGFAVQDRSHDNDNPDNQLYLDQQILNTGTSSVAMSSLTVRYWFTNTNPSDPPVFNCDYALVGCSNITAKFVVLATPIAGKADRYLQIGFTAGSIAAGQSGGEMQMRIHDTAYSNFNTAQAYSFVSDPSFVFKNTLTVTLYQNGVLVSGTEP
jgi:cellulose 1,4-beta-cellobiosidase